MNIRASLTELCDAFNAHQGRGRKDHLSGINVGRPPLRCAASLKTRNGLTRIPFLSFGNIIATVSKSEQRVSVGRDRLVAERREPPSRRCPKDGPSFVPPNWGRLPEAAYNVNATKTNAPIRTIVPATMTTKKTAAVRYINTLARLARGESA
jgi:hypothetical protein